MAHFLHGNLPMWKLSSRVFDSGDFTNQNATQFGNTETEKGPGRERRHERGKNKVTNANATTAQRQSVANPLKSVDKQVFVL